VMTPAVRDRYDRWKSAPLTWDPVEGGKLPLVHWRDHKVADLGADPDGVRFERIAGEMKAGKYYPTDLIAFHGRYQDENRDLIVGDRILQEFFFVGVTLWSMVEIWIAEKTDDSCHIGYVTTRHHHGRGIWEAKLTRADGRLTLEVKSVSGPQSWLFWIGLPVARAVQLHARALGIRNKLR
jgi:Domain of unknown function (DUF1990)